MDRDPDLIQREIEQTREEFAETIGAIADRVSPKRAATRGVQKVKTAVEARVDSVRQRGGPDEPAAVEAAAATAEPPKALIPGETGGTEVTAEVEDPQATRAGPVVSPEQAIQSGVPEGNPYLAAPGVVRFAGGSPATQTVLRKGRIAAAACTGAGLLAWYLLRRRSSS